jgi:hypothetical protein
MDIEAQPKNASDTQPAINPDIRPANTAADLPSSNTDRQPQATNTSEKHTQQTADNSDGQSGMLTCPFNKFWYHCCTRREPWRLL